MRTLKRPKLIFNIKYIAKINIANLKNNITLSNISNNLINLKKEVTNINTDIIKLKSSLLKINTSYGYTEFIEIKEQKNILEKEKAYEKIYNINSSNINKPNNEPNTKALTVIKTRLSFKYSTNYKKSCQIFIKILNHIFNVNFFKFLYIKRY